MKRHYKTAHSNCEICQKSFKTDFELYKHIRKCHKDHKCVYVKKAMLHTSKAGKKTLQKLANEINKGKLQCEICEQNCQIKM